MIQLFARTMDLHPQSAPTVPYMGYFNDLDEGLVYHHLQKDGEDWDCYKLFLEDITKNGLKYAIKVDWMGIIHDGECRYWIARKIGLEYVPIDAHFLMNGKGAKHKVKKVRNLDYQHSKDCKEFWRNKHETH